MFACRAVAEIGGARAVAFNLLLNPEIERRGREDPDWLRRRLVRHVGSHVPLVIAYGLSEAGVFHVHGAVAPSSTADLEHITAALEGAGGPWAARRGDHHQLVIKPLYDADGWARYLMRNVAEAREISTARLWSITGPARRKAKAMHADISVRLITRA